MELVTIKSKPTDVRPGWEDNDGSTHWKCTLEYVSRKMRAGFSMGAAHEGVPEAGDVLSCLLSDAQSSQESLRDFCASMGLDDDSRKAAKMWHACRKTATKLKVFLGPEMWQKSKHVNNEEFARYLTRGTTEDEIEAGKKATDWIEFTYDDRQFRARLVYGFDVCFAIKTNQPAAFHARPELQELNEGVEIWSSSHLEDVMERIPKEVKARWEKLMLLDSFYADHGPWYYIENTMYAYELATGLRPRSKDESMPEWLRRAVESKKRDLIERWGKDSMMVKGAKPSDGQWFLVFQERFKHSCLFGILDPEPPFPWNDKLPADPYRDFPRPNTTALMSLQLKELQTESMKAWLQKRHSAVMEAGWAILTAEGFDREAILKRKVSA